MKVNIITHPDGWILDRLERELKKGYLMRFLIEKI